MIVDSTVLICLGNLGKIELVNNCLIITNDPAKSALFSLKFQKDIPLEKSVKQSLKILGDKYETGDSDIVALLIDSPESIIATDVVFLWNIF